MGWINGNSPASETCVHEVGIFPQLEGLFRVGLPPPDAGAPGVEQRAPVAAGTAAFLSFLLAQSVAPSGLASPRWALPTGNDWSFAGIIDQYPHILLAAYYHLLNSGDNATVAEWMPVLDRVAGCVRDTRMHFPYGMCDMYMQTAMCHVTACRYMRGPMLVDASGLLTNTNPSCAGLANISLSDNWVDDLRAGWHDGIVGVYVVRSTNMHFPYGRPMEHTYYANRCASRDRVYSHIWPSRMGCPFDMCLQAGMRHETAGTRWTRSGIFFHTVRHNFFFPPRWCSGAPVVSRDRTRSALRAAWGSSRSKNHPK